MLNATTVVMCKTCHRDGGSHFLALLFGNELGQTGTMSNPPDDICRMLMKKVSILIVYTDCNRLPEE